MKAVAPFNQQSLWAEHVIKSLSTILTKYLTGFHQIKPKYLPLATLAYSLLNTPNQANYGPYELVFGRKLKLLLDLGSNPDIKILGTVKVQNACSGVKGVG